MTCPWCDCQKIVEFHRDKHRIYFRCQECELISVPRSFLLAPHEEKKRYDAHQNNPEDPGYVKYLEKISLSILPFLPKSGEGLDFGCGRTKLLAQLLMASSDLEITSFDLFFFPDEEIWSGRYDVIILSEVIEHLARPWETMTKLAHLLKSGGQLFIKTKLSPGTEEEFRSWFYKRDLTHVQFFNRPSLRRLARDLKLEGPEEVGEDLFRFRK